MLSIIRERIKSCTYMEAIHLTLSDGRKACISLKGWRSDALGKIQSVEDEIVAVLLGAVPQPSWMNVRENLDFYGSVKIAPFQGRSWTQAMEVIYYGTIGGQGTPKGVSFDHTPGEYHPLYLGRRGKNVIAVPLFSMSGTRYVVFDSGWTAMRYGVTEWEGMSEEDFQ